VTKATLLDRVRRIRGQVDGIEKALLVVAAARKET
jgi:DNA-binding FrmR family transcriptional regulator